MANKKVARSRPGVRRLTVIQHLTHDGEHFAHVFERSSGLILAVAIGSRGFAQRTARQFAAEWVKERIELQGRIEQHQAAVRKRATALRYLEQQVVARASATVRGAS